MGGAPWAALGSVLKATRRPIEIIGAALARETEHERAATPAPHITFGVSWGETLDGAVGDGMACRAATPALVACELGRGMWLHDAQHAKLLFDRRDGGLVAIMVVSRILSDNEAGKSGREIKRRFAEIKAAIDGLLTAGYATSVRAHSPAGVPFWLGLRATDGHGAYAARWTAQGHTVGPTVSLQLFGVDAARGYCKLLVERPV